MLDLHRLKVLRELDARGTVHGAARALDYTPSAISQQLAVLEREAGAKLLERSGRNVRLTEAGRVLVRHATSLLYGVEAAEAELAGIAAGHPAGVVRVYQADSKGGTQFVGEDRIAHTPKDEELNLHIGNAFDVVCERKQIDFQKIAVNVYELEYEITLRNHKTTPITVEVNEPIGGTWRMLRSSHQWQKSDAWAAGFTVPVAADGTGVLKYRVRAKW